MGPQIREQRKGFKIEHSLTSIKYHNDYISYLTEAIFKEIDKMPYECKICNSLDDEIIIDNFYDLLGRIRYHLDIMAPLWMVSGNISWRNIYYDSDMFVCKLYNEYFKDNRNSYTLLFCLMMCIIEVIIKEIRFEICGDPIYDHRPIFKFANTFIRIFKMYELEEKNCKESDNNPRYHECLKEVIKDYIILCVNSVSCEYTLFRNCEPSRRIDSKTGIMIIQDIPFDEYLLTDEYIKERYNYDMKNKQ